MIDGLIAIVIAYLLGSVPFGYLLVRLTTGKDVRAAGSGNIGATNVFRTTGRGIGLLTLLLDALKAVLAVYLAGRLTGGDEIWTGAAAFAVLLGHVFPVFLRFKGGKAVASFAGAFLYLAPVALFCVFLVFVVTVWRTRFVSLGSIIGAITFPIAVWIILRPHWPLVTASILCCALVLWRHKPNLIRLHEGNEATFSFGRSRG
jgi:glycerol-3-phosphate acyltransferase PlsY